jgi:tRNA CCA-adding enzyme
MKNIKKILKNETEIIRPERSMINKIKKISWDFCIDLSKKLKKNKINADVFIGGSLAKNTFIKKQRYDVDIFVRFEEKYNSENISKVLGRLLSGKIKKIHGSRDYYQIEKEGILLEIVPVLKIKNPLQAKNITDLSYFHVNYILGKINRKKILADEIKLAKTFAHAQGCYGAEGYINGFSGYSLELLICHYGSFLKFIKEISKSREEKIIIDDSKFYKKKQDVLIELNESKIQGPIILIDPTFKERNALAGLNKTCFFKFKKVCQDFLKNPEPGFFVERNIEEELKKKYKNELKVIEVTTSKQKGDISGTKSKKFFYFFVSRLEKEFKVDIREFYYNDNLNIAFFYFVLNKKESEIIKGPKIIDIRNLTRFKKVHPDSFIKKGFSYARIKHELSFKKFVNNFLKKERGIIKQMSINKIKIIK